MPKPFLDSHKQSNVRSYRRSLISSLINSKIFLKSSLLPLKYDDKSSWLFAYTVIKEIHYCSKCLTF